MYMTVGLFLIVVFYFLAKFLKKVQHIKQCLESIPGPPPNFLFGNALDFLGDKGIIRVFVDHTKKYGTMWKSRFAPFVYSLVISDRELIKQILLKNANLSKGRIYDLTKCWLGEGLLTSEECKWRNQRRMLTPAFSNKILKDFVAVFDRQANTLTEKLWNLTPVDTINIHELLSLCSLDIICETTLGVSVHTQMNEDHEYVGCIKDICKLIANRSTSIWKLFEPLFWFSSDYRKQKKCLEIIKKHVNNVISAKKEQIAMDRSYTNKSDEFGRKEKLALLDILLEYSENGKHLDEKEIEDEVHTFMFAGHDTTTAAMDFIIYELARNPNIQELAFQEQKRIFGNNNFKEIRLTEIQEMKYLDMVIKEALRLYPPVSLIARRIDEEFKFQNYIIPRGIIIWLFIYGIHRNAELFPNPDVFDPLRFENPDVITPFSFIPFSTGPRNCIGQKFAIYEMKVILSKLLRNFEFSSAIPQHDLDLRAEVVLTSRNGVNVKIVKRK